MVVNSATGEAGPEVQIGGDVLHPGELSVNQEVDMQRAGRRLFGVITSMTPDSKFLFIQPETFDTEEPARPTHIVSAAEIGSGHVVLRALSGERPVLEISEHATSGSVPQTA